MIVSIVHALRALLPHRLGTAPVPRSSAPSVASYITVMLASAGRWGALGALLFAQAALFTACGGGDGELAPPTQNPPVVTSVNPSPVPGSDTPQTILVNGSGFADKPSVTLSWTGMATYAVPGSQVVFVNGSQLQVSFTTTTAPDSWTVRVTNPNGQTSNALAFTVVNVEARSYIDDYPVAYRSADYNTPDPWNFYFRECTSFVAWRMNRDTSTAVAPYFFTNLMDGERWGGAENWAANAAALGVRVDQTPSVGAIAHWGAGELSGASGHVAYVERVNVDGSVDVTEYNYRAAPNDHAFGFRLNLRPSRFIHVEAWPIYAASSGGMLYRVETSSTGTDTAIGVIRTGSGVTPTITDVAVTPTSQVYAVSFSTLYSIDPLTAVATQIGNGLGEGGVNALASDSAGNLYAATTSGNVLRVDATTGLSTRIGPYGSGYSSDGDVAFSTTGVLFAAVQGSSSNSVLATVSLDTGAATRVGSTLTDSGFANVYSLSAVGGRLFGLTTDAAGGSLVRFDLNSGQATLVRKLQFSAR
jgi:surface antigen